MPTSTTEFATVDDALAGYQDGRRAAVVAQARAEEKAVKAARAAKAKLPPTPAMQAIERAHAEGIQPPTRRRGEPRAPRVVVHHFINGKPMPASQDKLSSMAWYATRNIDGENPRISTDALIALLAGAGVSDPRSTSWDVELPNGTLVAARVEGDNTPVKQPAPVAAKAVTKKAAAAKKAPTKKAKARR